MKEKLCACGAAMDRHSKICRSCYKKSVEVDPEEWRIRHNENARRWRAANHARSNEHARKARAKWVAENPQRAKEVQRHNRERVRKEILGLVGGVKCAACGFSDWRALQLDHRNGGGNRDRFRGLPLTAGAGLWKLRKWMKENLGAAREKYQVLCANCNWIKRHEAGECSNTPRVNRLAT